MAPSDRTSLRSTVYFTKHACMYLLSLAQLWVNNIHFYMWPLSLDFYVGGSDKLHSGRMDRQMLPNTNRNKTLSSSNIWIPFRDLTYKWNLIYLIYYVVARTVFFLTWVRKNLQWIFSHLNTVLTSSY